MAKLFYRVSFVGDVNGREKIVNSFDYIEENAPAADNDPEYCQSVAEFVRDHMKDEYKELFDSSYILRTIECEGWDEDGDKAEFPAVQLEVNEIGVGGPWTFNGNAQCLILKKVIGLGEVVFPTGHRPKRGYMAYSPVAQDYITAEGIYDPSVGFGVTMNAWLSKMSALVPEAGGFFLQPVVLGFTFGATPGEQSENVTAYSPVIGALVRPRASFRRSRNNDR